MKTLSLHKPAVLVSSEPHPHESVMVPEVINILAPADGEVVIDATAGGGGHSEALLSRARIRLIAFDADPLSIVTTERRLLPFGRRVQVIESQFGSLMTTLQSMGIERVNKILFDLGWNTEQLYSGRGFSFLRDEPLLMNYGKVPASGFSARDILNRWSEKALADVFYGYGEERYARAIARAVVQKRKMRTIETTGELVEIIRSAIPVAYARGRLHPATRTFQALRIAVNDELRQLERGITDAWKLLACSGRIAVISFHSVEDRIVKKLFVAYAKENGRLLSKKPIISGREEVSHNPSARSAKLRGIEKICKR